MNASAPLLAFPNAGIGDCEAVQGAQDGDCPRSINRAVLARFTCLLAAEFALLASMAADNYFGGALVWRDAGA